MSYGNVGEFEEFLRTLHPKCAASGCRLPDAQRLLTQTEKLIGRTTKGEIVSQALWCDQGNHPFSARDPKAEHWERQVKGEKGEAITVPWDVCGKCMATINTRLAQMEQEVGAALPSAATRIPEAPPEK